MSLDVFRNGCGGSLDTSSSIWDQDRTRDHNVSAEQLRTNKVEEEHKRKKEERRRKREEATNKSVSQVDVQEKSTVKDTKGNTKRKLSLKIALNVRFSSTHAWLLHSVTILSEEW